MPADPTSLSSVPVGWQLLFVLALVLINGFFVAAEFALVSVRRTRIDQLAAEGNSSALLVQRALREINRYIAATQVGITLASLLLGSLGEQTLAPLFEKSLTFLPAAAAGATRSAIAVGLAYFVMTLFTVIIGELLPKSVTLQKAEAVSLIVVRPMLLFVRFTAPFVWLLNGIGGFLLRLFHLSAQMSTPVHSPEELDLLFTQAHEGGQLTQTERDLLHRVVKFSDLTAREVMIPRVEMNALPHAMAREAFFDFVLGKHAVAPDASTRSVSNTPHTRTPVFRGTLDEIVGVVHLKDLVRLAAQLRENSDAAPQETISLMSLVREALRVPETITIDRLLAQFQKHRQQMAVVIDEYGGTAGLVTMGDLLAQVFGEMHDEFDRPEPEIVARDEGAIEVAGRVLIDEINEQFGFGFETEDADTVAGLVLNKLGRPAVLGDEVEINGVRLRVLQLDRLRITKLLLQLPSDATHR